MQPDPIPPGWSFNPSRWRQRLPAVGLALAGCLIAGYLALYQLGWFGTVWDPIFGRQSSLVLHSTLSRSLPVPDAALGWLAYLVDIAGGLIGGQDRWQTKPWLTILYALVVGLTGLTSALLVIYQSAVLRAFCTLCLASALISFNLVGLTLAEALASLQTVLPRLGQGRSFWQLLLHPLV